MKSFFVLILLLVNSLFGLAIQKMAQTPSIRIGLLAGDLSQEESTAIDVFLKNQKEFKVIKLNYGQVLDKSYEKLRLSHIWIHKLSPTLLQQEIESGKELSHFVKNGGNLLLSMESVRLLNNWGIEKTPFEVRTDSVKDEGFGRPLGFHAFKSHPVFDGLNGGVYSWKGKKDHVIRKIGFFDDHLPDRTIAKVIGIEWTYITFHEQNKLLLQYKLGKGTIIAIGAYSYFAEPNFNSLQLHRFYRNLFNYSAGLIQEVKANYWAYEPQKVVQFQKQFPKLNIKAVTKLALPDLSMQMTKQEASTDFVSLAGRRLLLMGKQKGGIDEIWTHPFMSFKNIQTGIVFKGADSAVWLKDYTPSITVSPELLVRTYHINGSVIKEVITVAMEKPIAVIHYEWQGTEIQLVTMKYTTNFRYMWPYSDKVAGTISYKWSSEMNAVVSTAQNNDLVSVMGFSAKPADYKLGQYDQTGFKNGKLNATETNLAQLGAIFNFDAKQANGKLNAYLIAGNEGLTTTINQYQNEHLKFEELFQASIQHFVKLLKNSTEIISPDQEFNEGYKWSVARSDQFFQETPGLGTSLMAGFGPTTRGWNGAQKISGRPGYAWYFGRDAQWSGLAINAYGGYKMVKNALDVFVKFQDLNGKIYHELTSSGAVHYDASDATPLYVVLAASYLKHSGDLTYIQKIWPSLLKAMEFCYSTDTDHDGLIEITNVGHGWIEGGPLFGAHTEIYLAGTWVAALDAAAYLSSALNKNELTVQYKKDSEKVRQIIDHDFWDKNKEYFYNGKMSDGSFMQDETVLSTVPVYFNAVSNPQKAAKTVASFFNNGYTTDWGLRILSENSAKFNPGAYHAGMVWPLFTGFAALADYKTGYYTNGFSNVMSNLLLYQNWGLGSAVETLNGSAFKQAGVCSQQCWSETMIIQPVIEGMLGFSCDALTDNIKLAPSIPFQWNNFTAKQIVFGNHNVTMEMKRSATSTTYKIKYLGTGKGCFMDFSPALLAGTQVIRLLVNGEEKTFTVRNEPESIRLNLAQLHLTKEILIEIFHEGGIGYLPIISKPKPGDANKDLKLLKQVLNKNEFNIEVEGLNTLTYTFDLISNHDISSVSNGKIIQKKENVYTIQLTIPATEAKFSKQKIGIILNSK